MLAPAKTPRAIVSVLHREIADLLAGADVRQHMSTLGLDPVASTPDDFAQRMTGEIELWRRIIDAADIKAK